MTILKHRAWAMAAALLCAASAAAQPTPVRPAADSSNLSEFVLRAIEAPYLSDAERAELRIWHGVWTEADLEIPALRAKAALMAGVFDDIAFDHPDALPEDRAEALLRRGDHELALEALAGRQSARARMLRAQTLAGLGRFEDADAAVDPVVTGLIRNQTRSAEDLVAGVRSLGLRAELRGQPSRDYQAMMQLLARARDELDRGVSNAVIGMAVGEQKTVEIPPAEGYGEHDDDLVGEFPRANLPEGVEVGMQLQASTEGQEFMVTVTEINDETVTVDANHPLAGKTLVFDLEVVEIL